jgi:N-acetyl-anhydromuramyl-L-alanine amidase AmpD
MIPEVLRSHRRPLAALAVALVVLLSVRCAGGPAPAPENCSIVACGVPLDIGTRVVLWTEPSGYDAYRRGKFFTAEPVADGKLRYTTRRGGLAPRPEDGIDKQLDLPALQQIVHQFVLHFDVCGTSRQCFKVLQDVRNLSVHFLLDVDGTIYQTLDLRERAQHATIANEFSVGVEIAHPGTFPQPLNADMRRWYEQDEHGWRMKYPAFLTETGVRTPGFVPRPARPELVSGPVHGKTQWQFDYTEPQYEALAKLCAGLSRLFPRLPLRAPRDEAGNLVTTKLPDEELRAFDGIVGHFHVQTNKTDPGPALQWDRLLNDARSRTGPAGH